MIEQISSVNPVVPDYCTTPKADARETIVSVYREATGRLDGELFPLGTQFITMCAEQWPEKPLCELEQMLRLGMRLESYVGIDWDKEVISRNRERYPTACWIHGAWIDSLMELEPLAPAFIHYDTTNQSDHEPAISMLASTMEFAPVGCFVAANFVTKNPYSGEVTSIDKATEGLARYMQGGLNNWRHCGSFSYCGSVAEMTYLLLLKEKS
jgi:hypothetical protein